jgi:hypothetical protein
MNHSQIVNNIHKFVIFYIAFGWLIENQRNNLLFFLPTIQFQFLVNNNMCILTQLENKLLLDEAKKNDSEEDSIEEEMNDSFIDKTLKKYNINMKSEIREKMIHVFLYSSFCITYFLS